MEQSARAGRSFEVTTLSRKWRASTENEPIYATGLTATVLLGTPIISEKNTSCDVVKMEYGDTCDVEMNSNESSPQPTNVMNGGNSSSSTSVNANNVYTFSPNRRAEELDLKGEGEVAIKVVDKSKLDTDSYSKVDSYASLSEMARAQLEVKIHKSLTRILSLDNYNKPSNNGHMNGDMSSRQVSCLSSTTTASSSTSSDNRIPVSQQSHHARKDARKGLVGESLTQQIQVLQQGGAKSSTDPGTTRIGTRNLIGTRRNLIGTRNIIPLLGAEETQDSIILITPYTKEGDLWEKIRYGTTLVESEARNCVGQVLNALQVMHHELHLIHADVKPHNLLLFKVRDKYVVQLCDFGLTERLEDTRKDTTLDKDHSNFDRDHSSLDRDHSNPSSYYSLVDRDHSSYNYSLDSQNYSFNSTSKLVNDSQNSSSKLVNSLLNSYNIPINKGGKVRFTGLRGTSGYFAPEMLNGEDYEYGIDIFALGVILFIMLGGYEPFFPPTNFAKLEFEEVYWSHISNEGKDFIQGLLELDPLKRLTSLQALEHPWFSTVLSDTLPSHGYGAPPDQELQFYKPDEVPYIY